MKKEFNFMIDNKLEKNILSYCKKRKISYNRAINEIIELMLPVIKEIHYFSEENDCKYQRIDAVKKIHLYMPKEIYRELKLVHSNLNFYSIAILVRFMLDIYFEWLEETNDNETKIKERVNEIITKIDDRLKKSNYEVIKNELKVRIGQLSCNPFPHTLKIHYNFDFSIHKIEFL
ncbi:MAG TPA: hypothetical protein PLE45_01120 [Spirochaetota bacterium]|nr:hypothetical protein [Spirochaetota bacterium]HOL56068.1 hypothetical protein [Spirochaetota bacterium]HPP03214.1 hypothetical protein [Spirochaetota bacterium]